MNQSTIQSTAQSADGSAAPLLVNLAPWPTTSNLEISSPKRPRIGQDSRRVEVAIENPFRHAFPKERIHSTYYGKINILESPEKLRRGQKQVDDRQYDASKLAAARRSLRFDAEEVPGEKSRGLKRAVAHKSEAATWESLAAGSDNNLVGLKRDREREGRCSECGMQTHEWRVDARTGARTKVPLMIEYEVHRGRCLLCRPLPGSSVVGTPVSVCSQSQATTSLQSSVLSSHGSIRSHATDSMARIVPEGNASVRSVHSAPADYGHATSCYLHSDKMGERSAKRRHSSDDIIEGMSSGFVASEEEVEQDAVEEALTSFETESADLCDILAAMRRFPNSAQVQERGCEKLWIQSWDDETSSAIGRVGGIPTIIRAMRTHISSPHLARCGCEALQNLALDEHNREVIAESGGMAAIVGAMTRHLYVPGVQKCGCTALANIAADSSDNRAVMEDTGGLHATLRAALTFAATDVGVVRCAYQALRFLGYNPTAELERAQKQEGLPAGLGGGEDMSDT